MKNAIEIKDLTKKYNGFTLDKVNIELPAGYIMGFIGENGAGKTTTIKAMLGLLKTDEGEIRILDHQVSNGPNADKELKEHIGVVMDESGFPEEANIASINSILKNCYRTWDENTFKEYTERFRLPEKKKVKEYSKGMKMKLSIAVALSHDSKILILDEATGGLDPVVRDEILDVFMEFIQDETKSVFISSHILSDLEKICDYITFIDEGKIVFSERKDELLERYGILRCSESQLNDIDRSAVAALKKNEFGVEALVERGKIYGELVIDDATIEDIMVYFIKGSERK